MVLNGKHPVRYMALYLGGTQGGALLDGAQCPTLTAGGPYSLMLEVCVKKTDLLVLVSFVFTTLIATSVLSLKIH